MSDASDQDSFLRRVVGLGKEQYWKLVRQKDGGTAEVLQREDNDLEEILSSSRQEKNSSAAAPPATL